ncbi:Microcystin-dependent protein [Oscillibacter sp. PC13]|uniref:hypothetical protein n=1 Tax=Oscillibacter sp. PC13 TaxID=1855299 RepID=UPI0008EE34B3|nr:hypothetical protein [Oscillibacter sp. PC13]SFO96743.1 Microcystin-dependent protein [Oscillibacter sp. PC13]
MQQTTNYQLNQWDPADRILRTDFNSDNEKIDAALAQCVNYMVGMICAWSGSVDAIPAGWALCDGTGGTPDLRGRFLLGAGGSYAPWKTGGEANHTLTISELPGHSHFYEMPQKGSQSGAGDTIGYGTPKTYFPVNKITTSTGGGSSHNNMPPYYALCFVMYLGSDAA